MRIQALIVLLLCFAGSVVHAQDSTKQAKGTLVLVVIDAQKAQRGNGDRAGEVKVLVEAAVVTLPSGEVIGPVVAPATYLEVALPAGRVELTFRARQFNQLRCKLTVTAGTQDTVDVQMLPERAPAVWTKSGCKARH